MWVLCNQQESQNSLGTIFGSPSLDESLHASLEAWGLVSDLRVVLDLASTATQKYGHALPDELQELEDVSLQLYKELREEKKQKHVRRIVHPKQLLRTLRKYGFDPKKVLTLWFKSTSARKAETHSQGGDIAGIKPSRT